MKPSKIIILTLVAALCACGLCGCGSSKKGEINPEVTSANLDADSLEYQFLDTVSEAIEVSYRSSVRGAKNKNRYYYSKLAYKEYEPVKEFADKKFSDPNMQECFDLFYAGAKMMNDAMDYYKTDDEKFHAMWQEGYDNRCRALSKMVKEYGFGVNQITTPYLEKCVKYADDKDEYLKAHPEAK